MPKATSQSKSSPSCTDKRFTPMLKDTKPAAKPFINFIQKLYNMVNDPEISAICWNEDGTGVKILDTSYLCSNIFPIYFKHDCWASFTRQLNLYGFVRYSHGTPGEQHLMYKHSNFLRERPDKLKSIQRRIINSNNIHVENPIRSKPEYGIDTNQIASLQSHISELDNKCRHLKTDIGYLQNDNRNLNQIIAHNQSTLRYVMDILSRSVQTTNNPNNELNVALHALQSTFKYNNGLKDGQVCNGSNSPDNLSSPAIETLNPIGSATSKSTNTVQLPSIKFLL